ncbi:helix-turn-helix domain-containing protein [Paenibacillus sp. GCM10023252]|uniref:AraC family transcriptional regulator n=1 Tax=Paenibacillus sp. GCM10023252 TaxID=3252649 RepID=UPI003622862E
MYDLQLIRYYLARQRSEFSLPYDTYEHPVLLAPENGSFHCRLEQHGASEEREFTVRHGEVLLCYPGQTLHRAVIEPITFHFLEFSAPALSIPSGKHRIADLDRLASTFRYLASWHDEEPRDREDAEAEHYLSDVLLLVQSTLHQLEQGRLREIEPVMVQAASLIRQHAYDSGLSLQRIAAMLSLAPSQLTRRFQAAYAESPIQFATRIRLTKARLLLTETNLSLEEIAEQCGYENAFYLSRVFARNMKVPPSVYRKANRV